MEAPRQTRPMRTVAVAAVLLIVLAATVSYYDSLLAQQESSSNSMVSGLQNQVSSLQSSFSSLEARLAGNGNVSGSAPSDGTARAIFSSASKSVVTIQGDVATTVNTFFGPVTSYSVIEGSGFVTDYQNVPYIVTNFHVIDGVTNLTVTFTNGDAFPGKVVGSDVYADLAVVSVDAPTAEFTPLTIVDSSSLLVGDTVYAIGAPFGLSGSFTSGLISQIGRTIQESTTGNYSISGVLQFSAPINPGNSGGPLLDSNGDVVGITTAVISGSQGVGFAIPSDTITRELSALITAGGYKMHSYLGISGTDMNYQLAQAAGTNVTYGVLVEQVASGSPADKVGLKAGSRAVTVHGQRYLVGGDIIVSVNGTRITNLDGLLSYIEMNTVAGQSVVLGVLRGEAVTSVQVTLGARA